MFLTLRKVLNGVVVKSNSKLILWLQSIIFTLNLNLMIFPFNLVYVYIFIIILWDTKEKT